MTNFKKTWFLLEDIESNGDSDWLEKASTRLIARLLAPQARKFQSIDELFLATKRWFKRLYGGTSHRLEEQNREHVPKFIRNKFKP